MTWKHFKEVPLDTSHPGEMTGVEEEGGNNQKNIDHNSTDKKGFKDILDSDRCSVSGEEKSKYSRSSSNRCFMMTTSFVVITIICFTIGSYLAVRTKTNTDIISLTGR